MIVNLIRHWFFGHYTLRATRRAVKQLLRDQRPAASRRERRATLKRIAAEANRHRRQDASIATDPPSTGHLEWTSWMLAAYHELLNDFDNEQAFIDALGIKMETAHGTPLILFVLDRLMKQFHGNPKRAAKVFEILLQQYGNFFAWDIQADENGMTCTITRCWYFHFFQTHGVPRLTTCACRLDGLWFNRMDAARHGLQFNHERYTTKGYGSENCIFPIERGGFNSRA